ncbi:tetratricopeptide repeat protein [Paenibacillus cellulosilyticus]|uniref:Tetratricopeptide repeat protein n=1 Tax=Paenibacillus cellulosilyticus TaxID=375489 RepID=A0A2V2YV19_9BACL|nr:tetratricopeptide repeat protein [Paenibacillus cellulosilyticus]PWW04817.1 tetratricopeptide repeat protein [Paenibacillus cellulosilyticus]QKS45937.1 tetratricopeptide repeat protein [Paenibacillus cellulosilyticus]
MYESNDQALRAVYQLISWRRYKEALEETQQLLRKQPEDPDLFALLGQIYLGMSDHEKALHWSDEALKQDPDHQMAWYIRIVVYYERDDDAAFYEALPEAQRIDPYETNYYFFHANLLNKKGKYKEAKEKILQALAIDSQSPMLLAILSYTEALLGNVSESHRLDRQAIQYDSENPQLLMYLAWAAGTRGDYKLQETYMRTVVRIDPDNKQHRDEYLSALQQSQWLYRAVLWPTKFLRRLKPWQILAIWIVAGIIFRPLLLGFIVLYIAAHWISKGIVHVRVFGWGRRGT